jgi:hypothetical protein
MSYTFADSRLVWHIPLLCVQWKSPDDGQRNCPKHVEFHSKNKFEKLLHLVGFIIRNVSVTLIFVLCHFSIGVVSYTGVRISADLHTVLCCAKILGVEPFFCTFDNPLYLQHTNFCISNTSFTDIFAWLLLFHMDRRSSVGIATGYGLDGPGIESRWGARFFRTCFDRPWGPPSLLYWVFPRG